MFDININEYEWEEYKKEGFFLVGPEDANTKLKDLHSASINKDRFGRWVIILATYPFALIVVDETYTTSESAMEAFKEMTAGNWLIVRFYKPGKL